MKFIMDLSAGSRAVITAVVLSCASIGLAGPISFPHHGTANIAGKPFSGPGHVKMAIVYPAATPAGASAMLWSNDGTSNDNQHQPIGSIPVDVVDGTYKVTVGDQATQGKSTAINAGIFQAGKTPYLRTWFSDGTGEFKQVEPDRPLPFLGTGNPADEQLRIYVDAQNGKDTNSGLSESAPKKTIEEALQTIPRQTSCSVVITVAPGAYPDRTTPAPQVAHAAAEEPERDTSKYYDSKPGKYAVNELVNGKYMWRYATPAEIQQINAAPDKRNIEQPAPSAQAPQEANQKQQQVDPATAILGILAVGAAVDALSE